MAAPNIINVATITGKTTGTSLTSTTVTTVLTNGASSGKVFKINVLNVANTNTSTAAEVTVSYYNGSTAFPIVANVSVPSKSTLNVIDKSSQYYLEENTSITAVTPTASALVVTVSYEEIS